MDGLEMGRTTQIYQKQTPKNVEITLVGVVAEVYEKLLETRHIK